MKVTRTFEEYLTLLARSVTRYGQQRLHPKDDLKALLMGFEGPEGWVTVRVSSVRAWANVPSPMVSQIDPITGNPSYRRDQVTEKLLTSRVIQAITDAWRGVSPIKESPRILH